MIFFDVKNVQISIELATRELFVEAPYGHYPRPADGPRESGSRAVAISWSFFFFLFLLFFEHPVFIRFYPVFFLFFFTNLEFLDWLACFSRFFVSFYRHDMSYQSYMSQLFELI